MKKTNLLLIIAVIVISLATINLINTVYKVGITGYATDKAQANLSLEAAAAINFTTPNVSWGGGYVNDGDSYGYLNTEGLANYYTTGFSNVSEGLVIENLGNVNITLTVQSSKNLSEFIGTDANVSWKISENETNSCPSPYLLNISIYTEVPRDNSAMTACVNFSHLSAKNELRLDLNLTIPKALTPADKVTIITAVGTANN